MATAKKRAREKQNKPENSGQASLPKKPKTANPTKLPADKTSSKAETKSKWKDSAKLKGKAKPVKLTSKESHAKSKLLRVERRKKDRSHYEVVIDMKKIFEKLRRQDTPKDERLQLCDQMMALVRGKERDFVFAHDTSRICECLCKYAPTSVRSELFTNLKECILEMAKTKYSVFVLRSLLRHGTEEEKTFIIESLMSKAIQLIRHKVAGPVVEWIYNEYANGKQRLAYAQQFYGRSFQLLKSQHDSLQKFLEANPKSKPFILKSMADTLRTIIDKEGLGYSFVHVLFLEYFTICEATDLPTMAESLQEHIAHIAHTKEGARVAMYVVWYSSAKGRKTIIKSIKPYLQKLLVEENGHMVLFSIFDAVDDTKLVSKLIVSEIGENLEKLSEDKWGRHVIHYLLSAREPQHVNKEIRELLAIGDSNPFSKKNADIRQKELRDEISPACLEFAIENLNKLISNGNMQILLFAILKHTNGNKDGLLNAIVKLYNSPVTDEAGGHILDNKSMRFCVKKLLQEDSTGVTTQRFIEGIDQKVLKTYFHTEQGCFFISGLLKSATGEAKESLVKLMSSKKKAISQLTNTDLKQSLLSIL